jgi:hypothetical protein
LKQLREFRDSRFDVGVSIRSEYGANAARRGLKQVSLDDLIDRPDTPLADVGRAPETD